MAAANAFKLKAQNIDAFMNYPQYLRLNLSHDTAHINTHMVAETTTTTEVHGTWHMAHNRQTTRDGGDGEKEGGGFAWRVPHNISINRKIIGG